VHLVSSETGCHWCNWSLNVMPRVSCFDDLAVGRERMCIPRKSDLLMRFGSMNCGHKSYKMDPSRDCTACNQPTINLGVLATFIV